jgi:RNA polymerase sigma-70 factor (family 1)
MTASIHLSIESINRKDRNTFHLLYMHYYKILVFYSMQIVSVKEVAEDIVQDLFTTILERDTQFQTSESFYAYLYNSIRNASINYLRHKNVEESYVQSVIEHYEEMKEDEEQPFEPEVYRRLFKAIDSLPDRCKKVFIHYMDGQKNEEIATALNVSIETVKTQKKRAISSLRKQLGAFDFFIACVLLNG